MRPLAEQMQVVVRQDLAKLIRIGDLAHGGLLVHAESVGEIRRGPVERKPRLEQAIGMPARHRRHLAVGDQFHGRRRRLHRPHDDGRTLVDGDDVPTEDGERIAAGPGGHLGDVLILDSL